MPRGTADNTRNRILKAADRLFYQNGISQVSIDQIAEQAGVTKKTIYYHFDAKDTLIVAYLQYRDDTTLRWLIAQAEAAGDNTDDQINALFAGLTGWAQSSAFEGCPIARAASDLAHQPDHPALAVGAAHKKKHLDWLIDLAQRAENAEPDLVGKQLLVLIDGAIATTLVTTDPTYFDAARRAALLLLGASQ